VRLTKEAGSDPLLGAVRATLRRVETLAVEAEARALLTLLVSDGSSLIAARAATSDDPPTLYVLPGPTRLAPGTVVASEPLDDDDGWYAITPGRAVVISRGMAAREVTLR
jgi:predicted glutamine amidotransferase